jgi:hypothetical protein
MVKASHSLSRKQLSAAIDAVEARTGHQILVSIGHLGRKSANKADTIASRWPQASIVVCIDPRSHRFEIRWRDQSFALSQTHLGLFATHLRENNLEAALDVLATELPLQAPTGDLPNIVD